MWDFLSQQGSSRYTLAQLSVLLLAGSVMYMGLYDKEGSVYRNFVKTIQTFVLKMIKSLVVEGHNFSLVKLICGGKLL